MPSPAPISPASLMAPAGRGLFPVKTSCRRLCSFPLVLPQGGGNREAASAGLCFPPLPFWLDYPGKWDCNSSAIAIVTELERCHATLEGISGKRQGRQREETVLARQRRGPRVQSLLGTGWACSHQPRARGPQGSHHLPSGFLASLLPSHPDGFL